MRRLLIAVMMLMAAGEGWGAAYYVNSSTGGNGNSGTAPDNAWKNTEYALLMLSAGDTLNVVSSATSPDRGVFVSNVAGAEDNVVTIQGPSSANRAHLASSVNVSHGATIESRQTSGNLVKNGDMEGWLSSSSIWGIVAGSSAHAKETTIKSGNASLKIIRSGSTLYYSWDVPFLPASTEYTMSYWHYEAQANGRIRYSIVERDPAPDNYLQADNTWSSSELVFDPNDASNGAWKQTTKTFTTNAAGTYRITLQVPNDGTYYLDNLSLVPTASTYAWVQHSGSIYKLTGYLDTTRTFAKCTTAEWATGGLASLDYTPQADNLAAIAPGEWWWESGILYYYLADGETIDGLHIEAGSGSGVNAVNITHNYYAVKNLNVYGGNNMGINATGTNLALSNVGLYHNYSCGLYTTGAGSAGTNVHVKYTHDEDGIEVAGGDFTCTGCLSEYAFDDGFFSILTGKLYLYYSFAKHNGLEKHSDNSGIGVEGESAYLYAYNNVSYGNYGRGIQIGACTAYELKNNISWESEGDVTAWMRDAATEAKGVHTNNIFEDKNAAWTTDATESTADPKFVSAATGDFRLRPGSPAINAGVNVGLTTDFLGNPIRGLPDIGAYEYRGGGPIAFMSASQAATCWGGAGTRFDRAKAFYNAAGCFGTMTDMENCYTAQAGCTTGSWLDRWACALGLSRTSITDINEAIRESCGD